MGAYRMPYSRHGLLPRMASELQVSPAPRAPVYRVGRLPNPFAIPSWAYARPDGTFDGRFDDPRGRRGLPEAQRFRVLYVATESAAAFGETLAPLRPDLTLLSNAGAMPAGSRTGRPVIPASWRLGRRLGATTFGSSLPFVDLAAAETTQRIRADLAAIALGLGLNDVDLSTVTGPQRIFTQEIARYVYDQGQTTGAPRYAGLRYLSRLNPSWECWAIFSDRLSHNVVQVTTIPANHPGLYEAARILELAIEVSTRRYLYP